jgi:hypothetical protein
MALRVFKISDYNYVAESKQFDSICQLLQNRFRDSEDECILIGNYNIEGVELDALLITSGGCRILEFKNWGGHIIARENGSWTSDNMIIEGGAGKKTPYEQIRLNKSRAKTGLGKLLGVNPQTISAAIIFWQDSEIDTTGISDTVKKWLTICDNQHLSCILNGLNTSIISNVDLIPKRLKIEEFILQSSQKQYVAINETYDPESSTNFFDEIDDALTLRPNYHKVYMALNQVFKKCLNRKTNGIRINFGGDFAKTDYLLKENDAPRSLIKTTNDTRARLRKLHDFTDADLEKYCLFDVKHLCQFIAFIYQTDIPSQLIKYFPTEKIQSYAPRLVGECMRVIVEQWDDNYVYVQTEDGSDEELTKVCYSHGNAIYNYDWSYLKNLFYKDAQLNIIRPREDNGTIYPELIIFEPDYLVNISTVARCFTSYADSPFVDLIKKFEPQKTTEAIALGNLAGQLLDESIHQLPNTRSYADSVKEFYKNNAISLMTVDVSPQFHQDAQKQKQNIAKAIYETLPTDNHDFDSKNGIVEPSFFSEMLGLQGRMDYLQLDFKLLMEQKSGKGAFPFDNFIKPRATDEHYVQLLLYMALIRYNYRETYERNGKELHAFLLYSMFSESLLGLGFSPELIFKAIKVRNGIAWTEMLYTQPNGYRILDGLTPDQLNMKKVNNSLWINYQMPQIASILNPIQNATELEKAYFFRFLTFIANEHVMSKLGNKTKESSGFAATWHDSLSDKLAAGNIYDKLTIDWSNADTAGRIDSVVLKFSETDDNDMSNFRAGDIVILYPYEKDKEPDARKTMVFRCTIEDIQTDKISLALRSPQSDNRVFVKEQDKYWAIEHDFMESSFSSLYKGMQAFLSAPKERRDLLLLQREPETDNTLELKGDYKEFNDLALHVKRAKDLFLIIGPPGTGKTSYGLLYTVKEELLEPDSSILLLSYTNRAVDEICSKLTKDGIDFIRIGGPLSCALEYRNRLLSSIVQNTQEIDELKDILLSTRVIVGTTTSLNSNISLFQLKQFTLAIIDEASQILEPHLMGLLSAHKDGVPAIKKFVMIGDNKQLPAVVQQNLEISKVQDAILNNIHLTDCRLSLFERLLRQYFRNKDVTYMLKKQGRMHHDIALFPNYTFYNNQLKEVPVDHQTANLPLIGTGKNGIDDLLVTRRIAFIASESPKQSPTDKVNQNEADIIAAMVVRIYEIEMHNGFDVSTTVGVIVPYRNQIAAVRKTIDKYGIRVLHDITIDTVERYQGSQRKYIIYGFTIQKYYQLNFLTNNVFEDIDGSIVDRKLNVAMTRAEEHLIMVGNPELLSNNFTFFKLIEFVRSKHGFFRIGKEDFVSGNFDVPQYDTEELDLSKATFSVTNPYNDAYIKYVLQPVKEGSGEDWPSKVFGHDMVENLNAIGYGRINFTNQLPMFDEVQMSPERQVLVYCYYIMRQHYCSSRNIFTSYKDWIKAQISSVSGRVQMIDIGCGPATCGTAFAEIFKAEAPNMVYTGIDVSTDMKRMGKNFLNEVFHGKLHYQMTDSFNALGCSFWDGCSELPSLVIINMSYFFSNVPAQFTERLACQISEVMKKFPLNKYVFFIQHSENDKMLNSFRVFKQLLSPLTIVIKSEKTSFSYVLNYKERTLDFCYDIWTNKL